MIKVLANIHNKLLLTIFLILFFVNGTGLLVPKTALIVIISILLPVVLLVVKFKSTISAQPKILLITYLALTLISVVTSLNIFNSIIYFLFALLCAGIFVIGSGLTKGEVKFLTGCLIAVAFLIISYSLLLNLMLNFGNIFWLPEHGYQLVYSKFGSHNHLGDFIAVVLILSLGQVSIFKLKEMLLLIFLIPPMIFSYSRSAYVSFIAGIVVILSLQRKKDLLKISFLTVTLVLFLVLGIITTKEARVLPISNDINRFFSNNFNLGNKVFFGTRVLFLDQAFNLIRNKPLFGYGPGNYEEAIIMVAGREKILAYTSHNIIIDIAAEQGILAAVVFLLFLVVSLFHAQKKSPYLIATIVLLINFFFDYTFRIPGMLLLFFLFLGISIRERDS